MLSLHSLALGAALCALAPQSAGAAKLFHQLATAAKQQAAPDAPSTPAAAEQQAVSGQPSAATQEPETNKPAGSEKQGGDRDVSDSERQPKRILGIMPNYRAVSAGAIPPPPSPKQALVIATKNSFDYSSFVFVGLTSMIAEGSNAHPQLGKGVLGFGRYYWRGFLDKTDGNYMVIFALPTVFHQDERYYAMGHAGGVWKRFFYSISRVAITPNYEGQSSVNFSELLGRGIAQGVSISYYPSRSRTAGSVATKYGYAILRDAATNAFREFWPDIAKHVLHRHP